MSLVATSAWVLRMGTKQQKALDAAADVVMAYRPKPKSRAGKARKRRAAKIAREKPRDG